jgi:hypothetical protein
MLADVSKCSRVGNLCLLQAHMLSIIYPDVLDMKLVDMQTDNHTLKHLLLRVSGSGPHNILAFEAFQEYAAVLDLDGGCLWQLLACSVCWACTRWPHHWKWHFWNWSRSLQGRGWHQLAKDTVSGTKKLAQGQKLSAQSSAGNGWSSRMHALLQWSGAPILKQTSHLAAW